MKMEDTRRSGAIHMGPDDPLSSAKFISSTMSAIAARSMAFYEQNKSPLDYVGEDGLIRCGLCHTRKQNDLYEKFPPEVRDLVQIIIDGINYGTRVFCLCECQANERDIEEEERKLAERRAYNIGRCNMPTSFRSAHVDTLDNEKYRHLAKRFISRFEEVGNTGLLLYGDVGTGKSYLAACIANALLERGYSVKWVSTTEIVDHGFQSEERYHEYQEQITSPDLLVIDDLGAERGTDFALQRVHSLIDKRVSTNRPIIVTTNIRMAQMATEQDMRKRRTFDRIISCTYPLAMLGKSRRVLQGRDGFNRMQELLFGEE